MSECIKKDLNKKVKWFESKITELLNNHIKDIRVYAYLKQ